MKQRVKVTSDGGPDGVTAYRYHFPFGVPVEADLNADQIEYLRRQACAVEYNDPEKPKTPRPTRRPGRARKPQTIEGIDPRRSVIVDGSRE